MTEELATVKERIAELTERRDQEMYAVQLRYQSELDNLRGLREVLSKKPAKPGMLERYTEPEDSPQRRCRSCDVNLLRANLKNAQLVVNRAAVYWGKGEAEEATAFDVKRMNRDTCCPCCSKEKGKHCVWCSADWPVTETETAYEEAQLALLRLRANQ